LGETLNTTFTCTSLVTAGGLSSTGDWIAPKQAFLFPARALSIVFRGILRAKLLAALPTPTWSLPPDTTAARTRMLLNRLGRQRWHVQIQPAYDHPRGVILYLARYLRRGPLAEPRIQRYDGARLRIAYKRPDDHARDTFELSAAELIARLLTHVAPKGLRLVRAYGLFHHRRRTQLEQARAALPPPAPTPVTVNGRGAAATPFHRDGPHCPRCGARLLVTFRFYPSQAPPDRIAA